MPVCTMEISLPAMMNIIRADVKLDAKGEFRLYGTILAKGLYVCRKDAIRMMIKRRLPATQ